ncbi:MAG: hypothetical protein DME34_05115, partial [Verrucomicrobia bacterium]
MNTNGHEHANAVAAIAGRGDGVGDAGYRSEAKEKSFCAGDVADHMSILRFDDLVAQLKPAAQLLGRAIDSPRPAAVR